MIGWNALVACVDLSAVTISRAAWIARPGIVLVCLGPSEINHQAVAQTLGHVSCVTFYDVATNFLICLKNTAQILRVESLGKGSRSDQITKQHGHLPSLRVTCDGFVGKLDFLSGLVQEER
jgi:hypothetical protein